MPYILLGDLNGVSAVERLFCQHRKFEKSSAGSNSQACTFYSKEDEELNDRLFAN